MTNKFTWSSRISNKERLNELRCTTITYRSQSAHGLQTLTTQFFGHCVSSRNTVLFEDCNYKNEVYHITIA
jgi:hypothetical protein